MRKLYLPTTSLNFNNILSNETVSPMSFYSNRGYGYKRWEKVEPNPFQNTLLLYSRCPIFEIIDPEQDNYPLTIEIPISLLAGSMKKVKSTNDVDVYRLPETIYLNPYETRFLFDTNDSKKITLIKSDQSLTTKCVKLYESCMSINIKGSDTFQWSHEYIDGIEDVPDTVTDKSIEFDRKVDRIKGFTYCYMIGACKKIPNELSELKRLLKEMRNNFAGIKSGFSSKSQLSSFKELKKNYYKKDTICRFELLERMIERFQQLSTVIDPYISDQKDYEENVFKKFDIPLDDIPKIRNMLKSYYSYRESIYEHFIWGIHNDKDIYQEKFWQYILNGLREQFNRITISPQTKFNSNHFNYDKLFQIIEVALSKIERYYTVKHQILIPNQVFALSNLYIKELNDEFLKAKNNFFRDIINILIDYPIHNVDHFKLSRADITLAFGKKLREYLENSSKTDWSSSNERKYINSLLDYIENHRAFEVKSHQSEILQSLASFMIKGDVPEKLLDFLTNNGISDFRVALGLWGATFGYSAIPRTLTDDFISKENSLLRELIKMAFKELFNHEILDDRLSSTGIKEAETTYEDKDDTGKEAEKSLIILITEYIEIKKKATLKDIKRYLVEKTGKKHTTPSIAKLIKVNCSRSIKIDRNIVTKLPSTEQITLDIR